MGLLNSYDVTNSKIYLNETTKWNNLYNLLTETTTTKTLNETNTISDWISLIISNNLSKLIIFNSSIYPNAIVNKLNEIENKSRPFIA